MNFRNILKDYLVCVVFFIRFCLARIFFKRSSPTSPPPPLPSNNFSNGLSYHSWKSMLTVLAYERSSLNKNAKVHNVYPRCLCFIFNKSFHVMTVITWMCQCDGGDSGGQSPKQKQISSLLTYSQDNHRDQTVRRSRIFSPFDKVNFALSDRAYFLTRP